MGKDRGGYRESIYICSFFGVEHEGSSDASVKIIDKTNTNEATIREGFWRYN